MPGDGSALFSADCDAGCGAFTYSAAPQLTAIGPSAGYAGSLVRIVGLSQEEAATLLNAAKTEHQLLQGQKLAVSVPISHKVSGHVQYVVVAWLR